MNKLNLNTFPNAYLELAYMKVYLKNRKKFKVNKYYLLLEI